MLTIRHGYSCQAWLSTSHSCRFVSHVYLLKVRGEDHTGGYRLLQILISGMCVCDVYTVFMWCIYSMYVMFMIMYVCMLESLFELPNRPAWIAQLVPCLVTPHSFKKKRDLCLSCLALGIDGKCIDWLPAAACLPLISCFLLRHLTEILLITLLNPKHSLAQLPNLTLSTMGIKNVSTKPVHGSRFS